MLLDFIAMFAILEYYMGWEIVAIFTLALVKQRGFFIDSLLARIHLIIEMMLVDRPCAMGV